MDEAIAVLAPGGIGAPVGGLLTRAGYDVVVIDQWVRHVEAMKARGLRITLGTKQDPEGEVTVPVRAHHLYEVAPLRPRFDIVFLTAKSNDTDWLVQFIKPYLKPDGALVSMQNSLNEERIARVIGADRTIGCVLTGGGELLAPGHAWRNRSLDHPYYTLGRMDGRVTPELEAVVAVLSVAGRTRTTTRLMDAKWTKLVRNAQAVVSSLCNQRSWKLLDDPRYVPTVALITREALAIGAALGYRLEPAGGLTAEDLAGSPEDVTRAMLAIGKVGGSEESTSMVQQDIERGRPSEVTGHLNGLLVRKGREAGIPTPVNDAVVALFERLERGELPWDMSNFDLLPSPE